MKIPVLVFASSCLLSAATPSSAQTNWWLPGTDLLKPVMSMKPVMSNGLPNADGDYVPVTRSGIVPDTDQTQDFTMNSAFRIFGNLSGGQALAIVAIRDDGSVFRGVINPSSGNYAIVVPGASTVAGSGTYRIRTCYGSPTTATYDDPTPVIVTTDTMRNEALPQITSYIVSGTVVGLDPSAFGSIAFAAQDGTTGGSNFIFPGLGTYSVSLPSGTYNASILQANLATGAFSFFPVGTVTVVDTAVTMNFTIGPTAQLSGTVMKSSIPPNSNMIALETSVMAPTGFNCVSSLGSTGIAPVDQSSGAYQMTLLISRSYFLLGSFAILPADPPQTAVTYQWVDPMTVDFHGDTVRDATVSPPTDTIVISGQVTTSSNLSIEWLLDLTCGRSPSGSTAPPTAFTRGTQSDAAGNYRLVVPRDPSFQCTMTVSGPQPSPP